MVARVPARFIKVTLAAHIVTVVMFAFIVLPSAGGEATQVMVMDGVLLLAVVALVLVATRRDRVERLGRLHKRYALRKAALLAEQLLSTVLTQRLVRW